MLSAAFAGFLKIVVVFPPPVWYTPDRNKEDPPPGGYGGQMDIQILQLLEGAERARGLTVIIDVLRAFSLECFLADWGAAELRPVGSLEE